MKKKILILGASRYYAKSIETAKKLGYYIIVIDKEINSPGFCLSDEYKVIDIIDYKTVLSFAKIKKISGIVALNDFGVYTAAYVSEKLNLTGIDTKIAKIVLDKATLRLKWQENGQPNPEFYICYNFEECKKACLEIGFPVIFKPSVSYGGSRGVSVVRKKSEIKNAYSFATSFYKNKKILVEQLIVGTEHSAEILVYDNKATILSISDKIKTPLPYRVDKNVIYPTIFKGEKRKILEKTIINAVLSLGVKNGCAHIECCTLTDGQVKLFEIGLRPGGGGTPDPIIPYVTGINQIEQYIKICCGEPPIYGKKIYNKYCNYHFFTPKPGRLLKIKGINKIKTLKGVLDFNIFVNKNENINPVKIGSDRAGFIIIGGNSRDEVIKKGYEAEKIIEFITE